MVNDAKGLSDGLSQDSEQEPDGLDTAISKIQSYIANPKLITPQTLQDVLSDLMDYKDEEDQEPDEQGEQGSSPHRPGLAIMIGTKGEGQ